MRGAYLTIVFPIGQNRKAAAFLKQGRWQTVSKLTSIQMNYFTLMSANAAHATRQFVAN